jgi:hypothetical protein
MGKHYSGSGWSTAMCSILNGKPTKMRLHALTVMPPKQASIGISIAWRPKPIRRQHLPVQGFKVGAIRDEVMYDVIVTLKMVSVYSVSHRLTYNLFFTST